MEIIINNLDDMIYLAKLFANNCKKRDVLLLNGDLGAGKTFFAKHFAKEIGINEEVVSPTFTLAKEYESEINFYHVDAYRLEGVDEDASYLFDYFNDGITIIEWPEFISDYIPYSYVQLYIEVTGDYSRKVTFSFANSDSLKVVVDEYEQYFNSRYK